MISILLSWCHSEYVILNYDVFRGSQWNPERSKIAFVASKTSVRRAKGGPLSRTEGFLYICRKMLGFIYLVLKTSN
ncbi:MAG: hypothetical protein C0408_08060 [Odoribacter sp.]|nr:hypothetical protein [Odoribacter sp.]